MCIRDSFGGFRDDLLQISRRTVVKDGICFLIAQERAAFLGSCSSEDSQTCRFRELDRGDPNAAARAVDQDRFTRLRSAAGEQRVVSCNCLLYTSDAADER